MVLLHEEEPIVEETEPTDDEESQTTRYEITSFPTDFTVLVMYEKWRAGQLIIPDFQRHYVWNLPQASRLIESFLLGLPIPQVFLYRSRTSPQLLVVDGHQRLATISKFYEGQFTRDRVFRLRGINPEWNGKTYNELSDDDRLVLDDSTLRSIVIQQIQPNDNSSIYQIFERLNTGGTQLNAMEIRKAIFHGQAYDLLERLNNNPDWRALIGISEQDRRLRDVELVLRILALSQDWETYTKPMKAFITDYMDTLCKVSDEKILQLEQQFISASSIVHAQLGDRPFHLRTRLNVAALDSVMAGAIESLSTLNPDLGSSYTKLKSNQDFTNAVQFDTSDTAVVRGRFNLVRSEFRV